MDAEEALITFIKRAITKPRCERCLNLTNTERGRKQFLSDLMHQFDPPIRPTVKRLDSFSESIWAKPVYRFETPDIFGEYHPSMQHAFEERDDFGGWLLLTTDANYAMYMPDCFEDDTIYLDLNK